jgi:hypothetical protein
MVSIISLGNPNMFKLVKNKLIALLIIPSLIFSLVGQGAASGLMLCIGESEHITIEMYYRNCPQDAAREAATRPQEAPSPESPRLYEAESSCFDIPLFLGSSDPQISSVQYTHILKNMIDRASTSLLSPARPLLADRLLPKTPFFLPLALLALQSTVLLI